MTDPDPEPLAIAEQTSTAILAAHALRRAAHFRYLVFRYLLDMPDGSRRFVVSWNGAEWRLTADQALALAAFAAHAKDGLAGYREVSYDRYMLWPEEQQHGHIPSPEPGQGPDRRVDQ